MTARECYVGDDLSGAMAAAAEEVRDRPEDPARRAFLFEMLCFAGEYERAGRQLEALCHLDPKTEPVVQVYQNILHAAHLRRLVFRGEGVPDFFRDPPAHVRGHLDALELLRRGRSSEAVDRLRQAAAMRAPVTGTVDGVRFDDFRDCDDVVAPVIEIIVVRDYVWLPIEQIRELEIARPERPRDLIWAPARIELRDGGQYRGYVPALYEGSHLHTDERLRLGRATDWVEEPEGPTRGLGQRLLLAGEEAKPLLEIRTIAFGADG